MQRQGQTSVPKGCLYQGSVEAGQLQPSSPRLLGPRKNTNCCLPSTLFLRSPLRRDNFEPREAGAAAGSHCRQSAPPSTQIAEISGKSPKSPTFGVARRPPEVGVFEHECPLVVRLQLVHLFLEQLLHIHYDWFQLTGEGRPAGGGGVESSG